MFETYHKYYTLRVNRWLKFTCSPPYYFCSDALVSSQHPEGASYWQIQTLDRRLQRLKRFLFPTTMAEPGVSYDGAMAFSAGVLGELEKGCYAKMLAPAVDGEDGGQATETTVMPRNNRLGLWGLC